MKITEIEIKNFKAFRGTYHIDLHKAGKNLLVYGENGSGKSSLYLALKLFLESGIDMNSPDDKAPDFGSYRNIFTEDPGHIKVCLRAHQGSKMDTYEWSQRVKETDDELIIEASKAKGFLDYKDLLENALSGIVKMTVVNVFGLLVNNLLANTISDQTERTLTEDWEDIQPPFPRRGATTQIAALEEARW